MKVLCPVLGLLGQFSAAPLSRPRPVLLKQTTASLGAILAAVPAERRSLEPVARPLSAVHAAGDQVAAVLLRPRYRFRTLRSGADL